MNGVADWIWEASTLEERLKRLRRFLTNGMDLWIIHRNPLCCVFLQIWYNSMGVECKQDFDARYPVVV